MKCTRIVLLSMVLVCLTSSAFAQRFEVQPFIGYRWGGAFDIDSLFTTGFDAKSSPSYGLTIGMTFKPSAQIDLLYSHQDTDLESDSPIPEEGDTLSGFTVDNYLVEGSHQYGAADAKVRPFAAFGIGLSHFSAPSGFSGDRTQFALSIGGGVKVFLGRVVGLRFQGRWTPAFFDKNDALFCSATSGCYSTVGGELVSQIEVTSGMILRF
jgi:hypothetical protein